MKCLYLILVFISCTLSAQHLLPFDSLQLREARDLFADDYGNIYLYKNKDFSLTKYDSIGRQQGKIMLPLPFRIQSVQNPLSIPAFSENAQELRFYDQNLIEIQTVNFRQKFGYIRMVYAEDLQQLWLLDESTKRLVQYNFREDRIINSYPFDIDFEKITDLLVFGNRVYILTKDHFRVYSFKSEQIFEAAFESGKRLRRENDNMLIVSEHSVSAFVKGNIQEKFSVPNAQIVDKNSATYFVIKGNKLYLYGLEKGLK
jgi:hypothetical protein